MSPTTHRTGYNILNEFFELPAIGLEVVSDKEEPGKWPAFSAESDKDLEHTVPSNTPEALDAPQHSLSTGINAVSSKGSDILEPGLVVASAATSESRSYDVDSYAFGTAGATRAPSNCALALERLMGLSHYSLSIGRGGAAWEG